MATAINFTIGATDQTSKAMEAVNKRIADFQARTQRSMSGVEKRMEAVQARFSAMGARMGAFAGGAVKVAGGFREIARAGTAAYQRVGQLVPVIGALTSVATVAGISRMSTAWADWGQRIANTSQRIGIAGSRLSAFQGAAALAGSSGDAMTAGLQGMGQALYDAAGGRNTQAVVMARTLNLSAEEMKDSQSAMFAVANKIKTMRNPFAQAQVMSAFNIPEELLPAMRKGADGLRDYMAAARRLNPVSDEMIARAVQLHEAQNRVTQATEGLRNKIADRLAPVLTPLLMRFSEWIATSPVVAQGIEWLGQKVGQLGQWIENGGIQRFGATVDGWLQPLGSVVHLLGGDDGVLGAIEGLMALMVGSFALKVIRPWAALALRIATVTRSVGGFAAAVGAFSPPAWLAYIMGAGGAAAGKMNVPTVDEYGRVTGNWGGAQGEREAEQKANQPREPFVPLGTMIWRHFFGGPTEAPRAGNPPNGVPAPQITPGAYQSSDFNHNNPSNLEYYPGQPGLVGRAGRWGVYDTVAHGIGAGFRQMLIDQQKGYTSIAAEITHRSPPSENDTAGMIRDISRMSGLDPNAVLNLRDPDIARRFMQATIRRETGKVPSWGDVDEGIKPYMPGGAPMQPPAAQGAPMQLAAPASTSSARDAQVRITLDGRLDKGMSMNVAGAQGATVEGPLVERPRLLGAQP